VVLLNLAVFERHVVPSVGRLGEHFGAVVVGAGAAGVLARVWIEQAQASLKTQVLSALDLICRRTEAVNRLIDTLSFALLIMISARTTTSISGTTHSCAAVLGMNVVLALACIVAYQSADERSRRSWPGSAKKCPSSRARQDTKSCGASSVHHRPGRANQKARSFPSTTTRRRISLYGVVAVAELFVYEITDCSCAKNT